MVGVPAIDPVLKRAQFNQKINSLTQVLSTINNHHPHHHYRQVLSTINNHHLGPHGDHVQDDQGKKYKRNVSSETRRYAAIRLAASTSSLSQVWFIRRPLLAQKDSSELELNHHDWYHHAHSHNRTSGAEQDGARREGAEREEEGLGQVLPPIIIIIIITIIIIIRKGWVGAR